MTEPRSTDSAPLSHLGQSASGVMGRLSGSQHGREVANASDETSASEEANVYPDCRWLHCHYDVFRWGPTDLAHLETKQYCAILDQDRLFRNLHLRDLKVAGRRKHGRRPHLSREWDGDMEGPMFVFVRHLQQSQKWGAGTKAPAHLKGLEVFYHLEGVDGDSVSGREPALGDVSVRDIVPPLGLRFRDRPLSVCPGPPVVRLNKNPHKLVERGPHIVNEVPDNRADHRVHNRQSSPLDELPVRIMRIYVDVNPIRVVQLDFDEVPDSGVNGFSMFFSPSEFDLDSEEAYSQGVLSAHGGADAGDTTGRHDPVADPQAGVR